jgi:tetraacyldisaccharide 4'-kinase
LSETFSDYARRVMSGEERGPRAAALRAALACGEIPYSIATRFRNSLFDAGLRKPARLPRPVISVGNLTTGGTGKTPVVRWLAERLRESGMTVAILSRGYKAKPGELGDEQRMLADLLNQPGEQPVVIRADPNRLRAGTDVLRQHPDVDVFLLDDGFQHRQLARDFDLVLIDATEPFGFGRVLPRGMLREPLSGGLRRASAFLITRADAADGNTHAQIIRTLHSHHPAAPVYESVHAPTAFREAGRTDTIPLEAFRGRKWFAFCGIGSPQDFVRQLQALGGTCAGRRSFADHHHYTRQDVSEIVRDATASGAGLLVTTEKDWVKVAACGPIDLPVWRLDVEIRFKTHAAAAGLLESIKSAACSAASPAAAEPHGDR